MNAEALAAGALLTGGLIVAVGPQNLHVLHTGLLRRHVGATVLLCIGADVLLVGAALAGAGAVLMAAPGLQVLLRAVAVPLLLWMAWRAAREAAAPVAVLPPAAPTACAALLRTALVTFGNPAVWIETLLVFGSAAATQDDGQRGAFAAGALLASAAWFTVLGWGAGRLRHWLLRPRAQRLLGAASALMLALAALRLACGDA